MCVKFYNFHLIVRGSKDVVLKVSAIEKLPDYLTGPAWFVHPFEMADSASRYAFTAYIYGMAPLLYSLLTGYNCQLALLASLVCIVWAQLYNVKLVWLQFFRLLFILFKIRCLKSAKCLHSKWLLWLWMVTGVGVSGYHWLLNLSIL